MISRTRSRTLTALLVALAALVAAVLTLSAAPAHGQEVEQQDGVEAEQFSTSDTRSANQALADTQSEYDSVTSQIEDLDAIDPWDMTDAQETQLEELESRESEVGDELTPMREDLIAARIEAIEDAPVEGSSQERLSALQAKQDASETLQAYADEELSYSSDYSTGFGASAYPDYEDDITAAQADVEAAEENSGDGGAPAPSGSGAESGSGGDGGGGGGESSPAPDDGGGGFSLTSAMILVAIVGGVALYLRSNGAPGGGLGGAGETVKKLFKPDMAEPPKTATAAPQKTAPKPSEAQQQATPDGPSGGPESEPDTPSGAEDLNDDTDDVVRGLDTDAPGDAPGDTPDTPDAPDPSEEPPDESGSGSGGPEAPDTTEETVPASAGGYPNRQPTWLEKYGLSYTSAAERGEFDPVIGRADEIEQTIETLNRRSKRNPVLLGEAGVGKSAIIEGLAQRVVAGTAQGLQAEIIEISLGALEAGANARGDYEERLNGVIREAEESGVILFIDEMHKLMGSGSHSGDETGGADLVKPALARGKIALIGATTPGEYRTNIEKDGALARRFNPVKAEPLTPDQTVEVLERRRSLYEGDDVSITDDALRAAADYSDRYIPAQHLPDKALDLIDSAASRARTRRESTVGEPEVRDLIKRRTGIDPGAPDASEGERLAALETRLGERVIGQEAAVSTVARAVAASRYMPDDSKPVSLLFAGPSGVGKTELAKALAVHQYGSETAMIRLDMSEYGEKHSVTNLIGAARGYVGSDKGGDLSEPVRQRPHSVVLLDEIEKAHPDILTPLLAVLDDGRLTDNQGRVVSFKNTIVIMTTNAGAQAIAEASEAGEPPPVDQVKDALREHGVRPEWIGRVGYICPYAPLSLDTLRGIARKALASAAEKAAKNSITLTWTEAAADLIAELGHSPAYGARPLNQLVQNQVVEGLTSAMMNREIAAGDTAVVEAEPENERVVIRRADGDDPDTLNALYSSGTAPDPDSPDDDSAPDSSPENPGDGGSGGGDDTPPRRRRRGPGDYPDEGPGGAPGNPFGR